MASNFYVGEQRLIRTSLLQRVSHPSLHTHTEKWRWVGGEKGAEYRSQSLYFTSAFRYRELRRVGDKLSADTFQWANGRSCSLCGDESFNQAENLSRITNELINRSAGGLWGVSLCVAPPLLLHLNCSVIICSGFWPYVEKKKTFLPHPGFLFFLT